MVWSSCLQGWGRGVDFWWGGWYTYGHFRFLPHGVTVAQLTLDQLVKVQILVRQPLLKIRLGVSRVFFVIWGRKGRCYNTAMSTGSKKRIVLACGGTGGHIHPAQAVAEVLQEQGHELALILSGRREAEKPLAESWQGALLRSGARKIQDPRNAFSLWKCVCFLRRFSPDVLFATGGYTCAPPVLAARLLRIPVVLHEANSVPGKATRWISKHFRIETVATTFGQTATFLPWAHVVQTGLPLRRSVLKVLERAEGVERKAGGFSVLVTGGSQGAKSMDALVAPLLASLAKSDGQVRIVHQCSRAGMDAVKAFYRDVPEQVTVTPFIADMGLAYGQADLVIARAGAATCCEVARCAVPAIFIPLPSAADDHQRKNAEELVRCGGALCFDQKATTQEALAEAIRQIYQDDALRKSMREALASLPRTDATGAVVKLILEAARVRTEIQR